MSDNLSINEKIAITTCTLVVLVCGFIYMKLCLISSKKYLETKVINKGIYKKNPVYGEKAVAVAHSLKRIGIMVFVFSILVSILFLLGLYKYW